MSKRKPTSLAALIRRLLASEGFFPTSYPILYQWVNEHPNIIETVEEFVTEFGYGEYHLSFGEVRVSGINGDFSLIQLVMKSLFIGMMP